MPLFKRHFLCPFLYDLRRRPDLLLFPVESGKLLPNPKVPSATLRFSYLKRIISHAKTCLRFGSLCVSCTFGSGRKLVRVGKTQQCPSEPLECAIDQPTRH